MFEASGMAFDRLEVTSFEPIDLYLRKEIALPPDEGRIDQVRRIYELLLEKRERAEYIGRAGLTCSHYRVVPVRHDIRAGIGNARYTSQARAD